ncbi:MAG: hypothetical protein ACRDS9_22480, partial [Pseudonocardiaceae bacterium]
PCTALQTACGLTRHDPVKAAALWRGAGGAARPLRLATMDAWEDVAHTVAKQTARCAGPLGRGDGLTRGTTA